MVSAIEIVVALSTHGVNASPAEGHGLASSVPHTVEDQRATRVGVPRLVWTRPPTGHRAAYDLTDSRTVPEPSASSRSARLQRG